jgi:hypothetical protein
MIVYYLHNSLDASADDRVVQVQKWLDKKRR